MRLAALADSAVRISPDFGHDGTVCRLPYEVAPLLRFAVRGGFQCSGGGTVWLKPRASICASSFRLSPLDFRRACRLHPQASSFCPRRVEH